MRRRDRRLLGTPGRAGLWTLARCNPAVLVFLGTSLVVFYLLSEAIPAFIFWRYGPTYRQVDFVMEVAHENDGSPLAPNPAILFDMAQRERTTIFGTSPRFLSTLAKAGLASLRDAQDAALEAHLTGIDLR